MKAMLRDVQHGDVVYPCLMFCCPGCAEQDHNTGLHMLPVNTDAKTSQWTWDGDLEAPTLEPSILSKTGLDGVNVCHSYLRAGVFEFLDDCTHSMAGQRVPMLDLPEWVLDQK